MPSLGVVRLTASSAVTAANLAAQSRKALDRTLRHDAELLVAEPSDRAVVLGALQRTSEIADVLEPSDTLARRASGGAEARVGPGTLWLQLALVRADALGPCPPDRLLNRYVRPLLRALTKAGANAHYFDRDWISVTKRPVGMVAFAHDATTGRVLIEAFVGAKTLFALRGRSSYLGKDPSTLADLGATIDVRRFADTVALAYAAAYGLTIAAMNETPGSAPPPAEEPDAGPDLRLEPPWTASVEEAIGVVAAGRDGEGRMRIGGELMASRDAVLALEDRLAALPAGAADPEAIGAAVDATLQAPGVALLGLRSMTSVRDAIVEAWSR